MGTRRVREGGETRRIREWDGDGVGGESVRTGWLGCMSARKSGCSNCRGGRVEVWRRGGDTLWRVETDTFDSVCGGRLVLFSIALIRARGTMYEFAFAWGIFRLESVVSGVGKPGKGSRNEGLE